VIFIYREDQYADKNAPPTEAAGTAELIIAKQRNGPTGVVKLAFIRSSRGSRTWQAESRKQRAPLRFLSAVVD
jgi:replicative DNA helicase